MEIIYATIIPGRTCGQSSLSAIYSLLINQGFPDGAHGKEPTCQRRTCKRPGFHPWGGREDPLEKEMVTHSSILPGESDGQRSPAGYSLQCCTELDTTEAS